MTELILKNKIDHRKLNSIVGFLKAWDIEVEIKTSTRKESKTRRNVVFTDFGLAAPNGYKFNREEANAR